MRQKKTRGQRKRSTYSVELEERTKTEVHLTGRIEYVGENVVMVTMAVDREREPDRRGRVRGGRVGVSGGGGGKGRGGGRRRLFIEEGRLVVEEGRLVVEEGRLVVEGGGY